MKSKRGAIELSIGTIVILVLAMSMLILGLILVKNIFSGSSRNVSELNDKVKDQINQLFTPETKTVMYLTNKKAEIGQGKEWGIAFGIQNLDKGTPQASSFSYEIVPNSPEDIQNNCGVSAGDVLTWIKTGRTSTFDISPGETYFGLVRFRVPSTAPLCIMRFNLEVKKDGQHYATDFFDIEIV